MAEKQKRHALKSPRGKLNLLASMRRVFLSQYMELVAAVRFLSVLPVPGWTQLFEQAEAAPRLVVGGAYFPLVGMDTCDGLLSGSTRERKLEIMRDSRVGSFGVLGGACILLLKFALFASVSVPGLPLALLLALPSSRWAMLLALRVFPSGRPTGLGATYHQAVTTEGVLLAGIIALAIVLVAGQFIGLIVWVTVTMVALVLGFWITRSIGGLTGDSYGAIAEVVEVLALLVVVLVRA